MDQVRADIFDPDAPNIQLRGIYTHSFYRDGVALDIGVIKQGIVFYTRKDMRGACHACKHSVKTDHMYKAWLIYNDLKNTGWVFRSSPAFDDPVDAISVTAI